MLRRSIEGWLEGPPLVPEPYYALFHTPYDKGDPLCSEGYCYDSMRVFLLSFVSYLAFNETATDSLAPLLDNRIGHVLVGVVTALTLSRVSATYRTSPTDLKLWFCSSVVGSVHAIVASYSSIALALKSGDKVVYKDPRQEFFTVATTGYMLVDLLITSVGALFYKRFRDPGLIIHHTIAIPTLYYLSSRPGAWHAALWLTTELSNPFVNALWLLRTLGYTDTVAYAATGLSLVIVFFAVRIVLVFYYWYIVATDFEDLAKVLLPTDVMAIFGTCATVTVLNIGWFAKMLKGFVKTVKSRYATEAVAKKTE